MGVPPIGAAVAKPLVMHHGGFNVFCQKSRSVQSLTASRVSGTRGVVCRGSSGENNNKEMHETLSDWKSSNARPPAKSNLGRNLTLTLVSAAAASVVLFGENFSGSAIAGFVAGVITGGVPTAYADEETREDMLADDEMKQAPGTKADNQTNPQPATASDTQIIDEVWKVVDETFLPARASDGFDRERWKVLRENYLKTPPQTRAEAYDVIRDILRTLGDPFSRFVDPAAFAPLLKYDISGVGLNIAEDADDSSKLKVLGLVLDSPAAKAGVKQGDAFLSVDGVSTTGKSAFQAVSMIQASQGSTVAVCVRSGENKNSEKTFTLKKNNAATNPVAFRMEGGNVGYIRLKEFNAMAEPNVGKAVEELRKKGAESFVLDLRDNPGGLVQAGVEIARLFLPENVIVAYTEGRVVAGGVKGDTEMKNTTNGTSGGAGTTLKSIPSATRNSKSVAEPLVVLVNGRSASASEILTGALKDNCRATVAGSTTYGKGLIQSVYELSDGSGLVLTVGKYVTPGLHDIDRQGIAPDFAMFPGFDKANEKLNACELPSRK